jgi:phage baseplate assembly protein W
MSKTDFTFNNVGENIDEFRSKNKNKSNIFLKRNKKKAIGIKLPLNKGSLENESLFKVNYSIVEQIRDNLKFLLSVRKGEKLRDLNFGTNLQYLFNQTSKNDEELEEIAIEEIRSAVNSYMSPVVIDDKNYFVILKTFNMEKKLTNLNENTIYTLSIDYEISGISQTDLDILKNNYRQSINNINNLVSDVKRINVRFSTSR